MTAHETPAYFVFRNRVLDEEAMQVYIPKAVETLAAHGAEIIVLTEDSAAIEGASDLPRTVIIKFASRERAEGWYNSPEYQEVLPIRLGATEGTAVLLDGFEAAAHA